MASELSFRLFVDLCLIWLFVGFAVVAVLLWIDFLRPAPADAARPENLSNPNLEENNP